MSPNLQENILKDGFLEKQSKFIKSWRKRYVNLTETHLKTFKQSNGIRQVATEFIPLNNDFRVKSADDELNVPNSFKVMTKDRTFYFRGADNADKEAWIEAL